MSRLFSILLLLHLFASLPAQAEGDGVGSRRFPDIVILTVDTLRVDRLSGYGYSLPTSPAIDELMARGVRFDQARVVEPLTAPSMSSMVTSLHPHEHGATRNGLRIRPGLPSLPTVLKRRGYESAAFVGNWTLRNKITGLAEHFSTYQEVFSRKRWFFFADEATALDLNQESLAWVKKHLGEDRRRPFLLWVHYVEPHAPYRYHKAEGDRLGIREGTDLTDSEKYDTEVAFVDRAIGDLLQDLGKLLDLDQTLVFFASDHGESLGEHDYWGHGRHLYEPTLHIPLSLTWPARLEPSTIDAPASILDITPTVFGLLGLTVPDDMFRGFDWSPVLAGDAPAPEDRVTWHQAHRGAVKRAGNTSARRQGLLEIARFEGGIKEIVRVTNGKRRVFDLNEDPKELRDLDTEDAPPSEALAEWHRVVMEGLEASDELPPPSLDEDSIEQLRALGYID